MSLIFGINLCDRIYVSGDTRMSHRENGVLMATKDKICKVVPFGPSITGAFAGDADLSGAIARSLDLILPVFDIREFRARAKEFLTPIADRWWRDNNPGASVVMIFGGVNHRKRKQIDLNILATKIKEYEKVRRDGGGSMNMKPALFNVLEKSSKGRPRYLEPSDSHIFSVQIIPPSGFIIEDANWGEYLAYGPDGITKESLSPETFGKSEFEGDGNPAHDNIILTAILGEVSQKAKEPTISDAFVNGFMAGKISGVVGGVLYRFDPNLGKAEKLPEIAMENKKVVVKYADGSKETLTSIKEYSGFGSLEI